MSSFGVQTLDHKPCRSGWQIVAIKGKRLKIVSRSKDKINSIFPIEWASSLAVPNQIQANWFIGNLKTRFRDQVNQNEMTSVAMLNHDKLQFNLIFFNDFVLDKIE